MIKSAPKALDPMLTTAKLRKWYRSKSKSERKKFKKACDGDYVRWENGEPYVNPKPRRYFDVPDKKYVPPNMRGRVRFIH